MAFGFGQLGVGFGKIGSAGGKSVLLAAPTAPVLALTSAASDNTPNFDATAAWVVGDGYRFQYSTAADFTGTSTLTGTVDAGEDAANTVSLATGALADGTWYFRVRIERPLHAASLWSDTVTETIDTSVVAYTANAVTFDGTNDYFSGQNVTGRADGKTGTFSFWIKMGASTDGVGIRVMAHNDGRFSIERRDDNVLIITGADSGGSGVLGVLCAFSSGGRWVGAHSGKLGFGRWYHKSLQG
jgi:hypothetical protein